VQSDGGDISGGTQLLDKIKGREKGGSLDDEEYNHLSRARQRVTLEMIGRKGTIGGLRGLGKKAGGKRKKNQPFLKVHLRQTDIGVKD